MTAQPDPASSRAQVTVAIPTFNRSALLQQTIASVLAETDVELEVVVIDNASTDETAAVVQSFGDPRVTYQRNATNIGFIPNLNVALAAGSAPYLMVLHDDDLLRAGGLSLRRRMLEAHPDMVVAWSLYGTVDGDGERIVDCFRTTVPTEAIESPAAFLRAALRGGEVRVHMSAALIRRSMIGSIRCEEVDGSFVDLGLWMRLALRGSFGLIPLPLTDVRIHRSAGAVDGNFSIDAAGRVIVRATEQNARVIELSRRILRDHSLPVPDRRRLLRFGERHSARRLALALSADLALPGSPARALLWRAVRCQPSLLTRPLFGRVVLAHARRQVRGVSAAGAASSRTAG